MPQSVRPDMSREIRVRHELSGRSSRPRRHEPDPFLALLAHQPHGFGDVAIVTHHDTAVIGIEPTVIQQMHGEIDVRALFLGPDHFDRAPVSPRLRQWRAHPVSQKMSEIHLDLGPVALEGAQIDILALRFRGVAGRARDARREILDRQYLMPGLEHS